MRTEKLKQIGDIILTLKENNNEKKNKPQAKQEFNTMDATYEHYVLRLEEQEEVNTHLKKLVDQKANELNELRISNDKLISVIAHDLRGPFSSILGSLEILTESLEKYSIAEIRKLLGIASESAHKTLNLLDNLLMWAMFHGRKKSIDPVKINLHSLSEDLEAAYPSIDENKIEVVNLIDCELEVYANLPMVKTVISTLLNFTAKYTNKRGHILLNAKDVGTYIEISIKSSDAESLKRGKLFKTDELKSMSEIYNEKSTRLDLLLCKEFLELNDGHIQMKSEIGIGCEVMFTLPKYKENRVV